MTTTKIECFVCGCPGPPTFGETGDPSPCEVCAAEHIDFWRNRAIELRSDIGEVLDLRRATDIVLARWDDAIDVRFTVTYPVPGNQTALVDALVGFADGRSVPLGLPQRIKPTDDFLKIVERAELRSDPDSPEEDDPCTTQE